jgi:hypothetical protein
MNTIKFLLLAYTSYKHAKKHGTSYNAVTIAGVPQCTLFIALDREAWRVTQFAIETNLLKG